MKGLVRNTKKLCAVVTPHIHFPLTSDETISLQHLRTHLGHYDRFIIGPKVLPPDFRDFQTRNFPAHWFTSINNYSRLLVSPGFYRAFRDYKYILIYQLDCLVFSPDLDQWCDKGWDYAGAPWIKGYSSDSAKGFWRVGNGGLALRNVENALNVLNSRRLNESPESLGLRTRFAGAPVLLRKSIQFLKTQLHAMGYRNSVRHCIDEMARNTPFHEDLFWSLYAQRYFPGFSIPSPEEAVRFSFECAPRYCFKVTGGKLPFGCHAWWKYDREFWEPFLLKK
jgi:Protein of unknown function (DUF5672)